MPTKTKVLEFGRDAVRQARVRGERPGTFDFLGFTHYCSRTKDGKRFRMKRVTSRKKFRAKVVNLKESLKQMRIMPTRWILAQVGRKLRGHYAYYSIGARMIVWGAVCVNCARTVLRGAGTNW